MLGLRGPTERGSAAGTAAERAQAGNAVRMRVATVQMSRIKTLIHLGICQGVGFGVTYHLVAARGTGYQVRC